MPELRITRDPLFINIFLFTAVPLRCALPRSFDGAQLGDNYLPSIFSDFLGIFAEIARKTSTLTLHLGRHTIQYLYINIYIYIYICFIFILTGFKALSLYIGLYRFIFEKKNEYSFFLNIHFLVGLKK